MRVHNVKGLTYRAWSCTSCTSITLRPTTCFRRCIFWSE